MASASTLPGRDGAIAAIAARRNTAIVGIATPRHTLRPLFTRTLSEVFFSNLSVSPDGRKVTYEARAGTIGASLEILDLASREPEAIGTHRLRVSHPAFLSNGKIVFSGSHAQGRHAGTFEMLPNGTHLHRLFAAQEVAVSPDGRWFISTNASASYLTLFLLDRHGRRVRRLTPAPANPRLRYIHATFSPDGRWIAYERRIEQRRGQVHVYTDIFIVRRNGSHRRRLTFGGNSGEPVFSPSGRWIAYIKLNKTFSGNLAKLSVRHPSRHSAVTRVPHARFQSPAWLPR